jgi:hypothetical protein
MCRIHDDSGLTKARCFEQTDLLAVDEVVSICYFWFNMTLGRNERCLCGSGKKYKHCCLVENQPDQDDLKKSLWSQVQSGLIKKLMQHILKEYGAEAIDEAYNEFQLFDAVEGFDPESDELPLFMPWFFYSWSPDSSIFVGAPDVSPGISLLKHGNGLSVEEKAYLRACCESSFSFFEALEVVPGKSIRIKDILTEEQYRVLEYKGSESLLKGDLFFGKAMRIDGIELLEACSPIVIRPGLKIKIIELRKEIQKTNAVINNEVLQDSSFEILELYRDLYDSLKNPRQPILTNTDGHLMVPHKLTFNIDSPQGIFEALHGLSLRISKQELLDHAKLDKAGQIKSIDFPWLKKGNKQNKTWDNTVLGHIEIKGQKMTVQVNSKERCDLFIKTLKKRSPQGWSLKSKVIEPIESHSKNSRISEARRLEIEKEQDELMAIPEVKKHMEDMMKAHWDNWVSTPLPALGGLRPVDAVNVKDGREALEALLTQFERDAERHPLVGQTPETFRALKIKLGL